MAKGERKQIEGLPKGWVWEYAKGEYEQVVGGKKTGKVFTGRHAVHYTSGDTLTVKEVRNVQRQQQNLPKTPKSKGSQRSGLIYSRAAVSAYRGNTVQLTFRTLEDAQAYIFQGGLDENKFVAFSVQIRFKHSRIPGKEYSRPFHYDKNGRKIYDRFFYATLVDHFLRSDLWYDSDEWSAIYQKASEFVFDNDTRIYIYAVEK